MRKVTTSEKKILDRLLYPESFYVIMQETGLSRGELRDDLINLINAGMIHTYEQDQNSKKLTSFYDTDNLHNFSFRATQLGLRALKQKL